jgi:lipopolysaccharide export system permease protein
VHKLDRYISTTVLSAMSLVLLVIGGLDLLFTIIEELGDVDETYQASAALRFVLYTIPGHLYEVLPMAALIGAVIGLGVLAGSNELVIMQAAGISRGRIAFAVMKPAALLIVFGLILGEYIAPQLDMKAEVNKAIARGQQVSLSRFGYWQRDGAAFLHFNAMEPEGLMYGVTILEFDADHRIVRNITAEQALYQGPAQQDVTATDLQNNDTGNWRLENGVDMAITYDGLEVSTTLTNFTTQLRNFDLTPDLLTVLVLDPDKMMMTDLYRYAQRFARQGQDAAAYYLSFWKKLLQPFNTAVLVLVAVSFMFGPLRNASMGGKVFTAICFGLLFTILQRMLHNMSLVYQFDPVIAVLAPLLLCALVGWLLLRKSA